MQINLTDTVEKMHSVNSKLNIELIFTKSYKINSEIKNTYACMLAIVSAPLILKEDFLFNKVTGNRCYQQ